jgi:hypothetical protein
LNLKTRTPARRYCSQLPDAAFNASLSCAEAETALPGAYTYTLFAFACSIHQFCGTSPTPTSTSPRC